MLSIRSLSGGLALIHALQARLHGNAPSRGAQIDADLQHEDELRLQEKGIK